MSLTEGTANIESVGPAVGAFLMFKEQTEACVAGVQWGGVGK